MGIRGEHTYTCILQVGLREINREGEVGKFQYYCVIIASRFHLGSHTMAIARVTIFELRMREVKTTALILLHNVG